MNRPVPVRYRFALQLGGQQAGIGIERIEYDRLTAFCSIYVPISNNWLQSLLDVLDAEKEEFDVACAQPLRSEDIAKLQKMHVTKWYTNRYRLRTCKALAVDALERKTTIIENLKEEAK